MRRGHMVRTDHETVDWPRAGPWFGLAATVFFLNDFVFLGVEGYRAWLAADYAARLIALACLLGPAAPRAAIRAGLRARPRAIVLCAVALCAAALGIAADGARGAVAAALPGLDGIRFPAPEAPLLHAFDLSVGLALVALSEELAFRAPLLLATRDGRIGRASGLIVSALLFGLIHWSQGLDNVVAGTLVGLVLGAATLATRTLWPALIAHYLVDLWHFA